MLNLTNNHKTIKIVFHDRKFFKFFCSKFSIQFFVLNFLFSWKFIVFSDDLLRELWFSTIQLLKSTCSRNSKVSSHQANQMFVCTLTRIHIRVHIHYTHSQFSRNSKYRNEAGFQANQMVHTHTHLSSHIHTSHVKEYRGT